jgi:hypothetical protein
LDTVGKNTSSQRKYLFTNVFQWKRLFGSSLELVSKEETISDRNAGH